MSEYQFYEFRAIDSVLTGAQTRELRRLSKRADISPSSFSVHYDFGDFSSDPRRLIERQFDAYLHVAAWGTREFSIRLPEGELDAKSAGKFLCGEGATLRKSRGFVVVDFCADEEQLDMEDEYGDDGRGWMDSLLGVRDELARGDLRALYLGWLICAQLGDFPSNAREPRPPPGLRKLTDAQQSLVDFLRLDRNLLVAAAKTSPPELPAPSAAAIRAWVRGLSATSKDRLLSDIALGKMSHPDIALHKRFERDNKAARAPKSPPADLRSVAALLAEARVLSKRAAQRAKKRKPRVRTVRKSTR